MDPETHSLIGDYFFSYLLTCEVYLIEVLEIMAQMWQYISLKPIKNEDRLYFELFEKKVVGAPQLRNIKHKHKNYNIFTMGVPLGVPGVS